MTKVSRLELGFLRSDALMDEVLMEILDHLGIFYKEAGVGEFPFLISSTRPRRTLQPKEGLVVAEDVLPMEEILESLSGAKSVEDRDCFDLKINEMENKLLTFLRNSFRAEGLPLVRKWYWPHFSKACCVLTHDVDWLSYSPLHRVVYKKEPFFRFLNLVFRYFFLKEDYGYNIPEIIEIEKSKGVKSTFFLKTHYENSEKASKAQRLLKENGFEIGLHGSRGSHKDLEALKDELVKIQKEISSGINGVRYHILKFKPDLTWRLEEEAGLKYDTTFSSRNYFGFKSQICYPYRPIDLSLRRRLGILEIPTAFMDWTALNRRYTTDACQSVLRKLLMVVGEYNGCFAVNFHNTYLNKETFKEIYNAFIWAICEALNRGYWVTTASECSRWWGIRSSTKLELNFEEDVIFGKSSSMTTPIIIETVDGKTLTLEVDENFKIDLK